MTEPTVETFSQLGLSPAVLHALQVAGYKTPTPIQAKAIGPAMQGKDLIGCAATGTGKTAAFVLPLVERLAGRHGIRALILAPTRELALQIHEQVAKFGSHSKVRSAPLIGGVAMGPQVHALRSEPQIVIATPGRLIDHLEERNVKLDGIEALVLDEADRMLDMGFKPQLEQILKRLPHKRQTMLFSATMAGEVADFAKRALHVPVRVEVERSGTTAPRADQKVYLISQNEKTALLLALLAENDDSTLVFCRTKRRADRVARALQKAKHEPGLIHGERSQGQRRSALEGFKSGRHRVLVATDIAARGIDVAEIGHVVNYDLPHVPADYVHRVGRTARASASGRASSFCSPDEAGLLKDIERFTHKPIARAQVPRESPVFKAELEKQPPDVRGGPGHAKRQHHAQAMQQQHQHHPKPSANRHPKPSANRHPKPSASASASNHPKPSAKAHGSHPPKQSTPGSHSMTVFSGGPRRRR
ncbi:MAG: DEAD/DEAH box helicase [Myxococcaceae bacterium]